MNLALILTPYNNRAFDTISLPLGLAWLNSYLKNKIDDLHIDNYDLLLSPEREEEIFTKKYNMIGIQAHSNATAHEAVRIARKIKSKYPDCIVVVGGNAATFAYSEFLNTGLVDFVILGEGEYTFEELINNVNNPKDIKGIAYKQNGRIIKNSDRELINNLDDIPLPDRDSFEWHKYPQWSIMTSRGCPYSCSYCSSSKFWRNRIRYRSADNVIQEIRNLVYKYEVNKFYILDDTFGSNKNETTNLLNMIIDENIKVQWACLTRAEVVSEEYLDLFKKAGCVEVHFGLETANLSTQSIINKNLDIDHLTAMVKHLKKIGVRAKLSVIFGLPGETDNDVINTIEYLNNIEPDEVQIYPLMPYIGIDVLQNNTIHELGKGTHEWKQDALVPLTRSDSLSTEKQIELTRYAIELFQKKGYKWIPMDLSPDKHNARKIIKTVFAPIQGLEK